MVKTYGWHGKILRIDLSSGEKDILSTADIGERFVGGRGFVSKIYWDTINNKHDAFHRDNPLILMTGPLAGTPAISGSRWIIGGKSPYMYPEQYGVSGIGGSFGTKIKAAGYDGVIISGKAPKHSYMYMDEDKIEILDAGALWGLNTFETLEKLKSQYGAKSQSICIGPAGENMVRYATIMGNASSSGASGFGAVMGSKNLKAIVASGSKKTSVARPEILKEINRDILQLTEGRDIIPPVINGVELVKYRHCPGCQVGCGRGIYSHVSGKESSLKNCQSVYMYHTWDKIHHDGESSENLFFANLMANEQGICTQEMSNLFRLINGCNERGIIDDDMGMPFSKLGSLDFLEILMDQIVAGKGMGDTLAQGSIRAAKILGKDAEKVTETYLTKSGYHANTYCPRYFIVNSIFYATESTSAMSQFHETAFALMKWAMWLSTDGILSDIDTKAILKMAKRFWGSESAGDFSTYDGKALAGKIIQDRGFAKENLVLCDFLFPLTIAHGAGDFVGKPELESKLLSAVTGIDYSEEDYYQTGSRSFNMQRAINAYEGYRVGRKDDVLNEVQYTVPLEKEEGFFSIFNPDFFLPGPGSEHITRRGSIIERDKFDKMMDEYYKLRGYGNKTGLQKMETLGKLGLEDIIPKLQEKDLLDK
ncbi:aldehyde ferredoxin oxidoreductase N-terminal domain-containing protein [Spirochaetota bacterium]